VQYFEEAALGIIQGLQGLKMYLGVNCWTALFSFLSEWFVIVVMRWDLVWDGLVRIIREGGGLVFCLIWAWWFVNRVPGNKGRFTLKVELSRLDWRAFLGDAAFILIAGYADQIVSDLAGILTSRLSPSQAAGNHVVSRVTLYPSLAIRGLQAAINTLGSRYLGEHNDKAFVAMAFTCIAAAVVVGLLCTVILISFADQIFAFYTEVPEVLADLAPTPLAMAVQVSCNLVTTVVAGVVVAAQEFRLQSMVYASGLLLVFTPIVLFVANDPEIEMSITWLLWANAVRWKSPFFDAIYMSCNENDHFTKTGSGWTSGKVEKKKEALSVGLPVLALRGASLHRHGLRPPQAASTTHGAWRAWRGRQW
jgi:Na+-driven multidrug efflux pump